MPDCWRQSARPKRKTLRTDGVLETVPRDTSFADVAGLRRRREWIVKRKSALTPEGQSFGLEPPKGVLITGVQGCGKSLAVRSLAGELDYELARLDAGALYDKYVGESEKKLHRALELAGSRRQWCCGSMKSRKRSLRRDRVVMPMPGCRSGCLRLY